MVKLLNARRGLVAALVVFVLMSSNETLAQSERPPSERAPSESETIGQLRERIGRLELEQARLQQENQTMLTQLQVVETRRKLKLAQQDEGFGILPLIVSVARLDDSWNVRLQGADGVISMFGMGDTPQRGMRIVEISAAGVKVEIGRGKQTQRLALAYAGATPATPAAGGAAVGMPLPMPLPASAALPR